MSTPADRSAAPTPDLAASEPALRDDTETYAATRTEGGNDAGNDIGNVADNDADTGPAPARSTSGEVNWTRLRRAILIRLLGANAAAATVVFVFLTVVAPGSESATNELGIRLIGPLADLSPQVATLVTFVAYTAVVVPFAAVVAWKRLRGVYAWLRGGQPLSELQRDVVLGIPFRLAAFTLAMWMVSALLFGLASYTLDARATSPVRIFGAVALAGLTASAVTYFLTEQLARPLFAVALAGRELEHPASLGVMPRVLLAWLLGSGIPLAAIASTPLGRADVESSELVGPMVFVAIAAFIGGLAVVAIAARTVAEPLDRLQGALARVEEGDLGTRLAVDDGGDIGVVQVGFNRMVAGLAERQRIEDLFGRHVGEDVARHALANDQQLGGEVLDASALFVDVVGSTMLARSVSAPTLVALLNRFFDAVVEVVSANGGWVNKFEGDGALCVFGAPVARDDHATQAVRAARLLRAELDSIAVVLPQLHAGIGVSSGRVVAGNVGALQRYEYTVIGDPVNEAARITDLAKQQPSMVLASGAAIALCDQAERDFWQMCGSTTVRGRASETALWELRRVG